MADFVLRTTIDFILRLFGYTRIPKEIVAISEEIEKSIFNITGAIPHNSYWKSIYKKSCRLHYFLNTYKKDN